MRLQTALSLALLGLAAGCSTVPDTEAPAAPQLAFFSRSSRTTAEKTLELEAKARFAPGERLETPVRVKYGIDAETETFVELSPLNYLQVKGSDDVIGIGDLYLGLRHRFLERESGTSAGLEVAAKLPTGETEAGLGSGELDTFGALVLTQRVSEATELSAYYRLAILGPPVGADSGLDASHLIAFQGNHWFSEKAGLFAELANTFGADAPEPAYVDFGLARRMSDETILELALALGLNDDAEDFVLLLGVTNNFGRLGSAEDLD
jgi:hypothetical protein